MSTKRTRDEKSEDAPRRNSRRSFTKALTVAALSAPAIAASVSAQTPPTAKEPKAPPNPQPTPTPAQQPSPVAVAYAEIARLRFGEHLDTEQLESVKRDLEGNVRTAERLRAFKLKNSDEPDFVFGA